MAPRVIRLRPGCFALLCFTLRLPACPPVQSSSPVVIPLATPGWPAAARKKRERQRERERKKETDGRRGGLGRGMAYTYLPTYLPIRSSGSPRRRNGPMWPSHRVPHQTRAQPGNTAGVLVSKALLFPDSIQCSPPCRDTTTRLELLRPGCVCMCVCVCVCARASMYQCIYVCPHITV